MVKHFDQGFEFPFLKTNKSYLKKNRFFSILILHQGRRLLGHPVPHHEVVFLEAVEDRAVVERVDVGNILILKTSSLVSIEISDINLLRFK